MISGSPADAGNASWSKEVLKIGIGMKGENTVDRNRMDVAILGST